MIKTQHKITAVAAMFQNGISRNTKCAVRDGFHRADHKYCLMFPNQTSYSTVFHFKHSNFEVDIIMPTSLLQQNNNKCIYSISLGLAICGPDSFLCSGSLA